MGIGLVGSAIFFEPIVIRRHIDKQIIEADNSLEEWLESDENDGSKNTYDQPMSETLACSSKFVWRDILRPPKHCA